MRNTLKPSKLVTATIHSCEEVLDPHYMLDMMKIAKDWFNRNNFGSTEQYFMYSVFNKVLQSDMGKTVVRRHAPTLNAQSVQREFESHMSTSSKRLNERQRLYAYVSTNCL